MSSSVEFSWITHLNTRSGERAQVCKTAPHANARSWALEECCSLLTFHLSFSRLIKCRHPLATAGSLGNAPHAFCWWHTTPPSATRVFDGGVSSASSLRWSGRISLHHGFPPPPPLVNLVQTGCSSLSVSFVACHALKRMPEVRREGASIHIYPRITAVGGGGEPVETTLENLWVENKFFFILFYFYFYLFIFIFPQAKGVKSLFSNIVLF